MRLDFELWCSVLLAALSAWKPLVAATALVAPRFMQSAFTSPDFLYLNKACFSAGSVTAAPEAP